MEIWEFLNKLATIATLVSFIIGFISGGGLCHLYYKRYKKNIIDNSKSNVTIGENSKIGIISKEENHGIQIGINEGEINGK